MFGALGAGAKHLLDFSYVGSAFVFGEIGKADSSLGLIFAFQVLPTIIFIAAFFAVLYHLGVMQIIIRAAAWVMTVVMGASGAESLNVAASIFMGQTEAPLTIRPFLPKLTKSELMTVMTSGMAHISGGMMAAYIRVGGADAKSLLTAVIMTAPGTLLMAKMLVPETEQPLTAGRVQMPATEKESNVLGAIARGTVDGLHLALNVGAMLIVFLALARLAQRHDGLGAYAHRLVPLQLAGSSRLDFRAGRLADRHPLARCRHHRQFAGHAHGPQRICRLRATRHDEGRPRPAHLHHRHLRSLRLRQLQLHRHPDRRHRRPGPEQRDQLAKFGIRAMLAGTMANLISASIVGIFA